jgi:hypothetical protein
VCKLCYENLDEKSFGPVDKGQAQVDIQSFHDNFRNPQRTGDYDVLILLSGGKDSAYLMHYITLCHPNLRILGLQVDNGFLPDQSRRNAEYVTSKFGHDLLTLRPAVFKESLRQAALEAVHSGAYETMDFADGTIIHNLAYTMAAERKIPVVLSGVSCAQVEEIFQMKDYILPWQQWPGVHGKCWDPTKYDRKDIPKVMFPFWLWNLSEQYIIDYVEKNRLMPTGSPLQTNSRLITLMGVIDVCNHGASSFEKEFCRMIRQGKASRSTWEPIFTLLEHCGRTGFLIKNEVAGIVEQLDLDPVDLNIGWL